MEFPTAMRAIIDGKQIARDSWEDDKIYCELNDGLLCIFTDTGLHTWTVSVDDMMADDWVIYGEEGFVLN